MSYKDKIRVLFVCMGNICRSPTAEGVFRAHVRDAGLEDGIEVESAGTHAYHVGETPDPRAQAAALARGWDLSDLRARAVDEEDFDRFDYILAMDRTNLQRLRDLADGRGRVELLLSYAPAGYGDEIGDPYFGGARGFDVVLDQIEAASRGLLAAIVRRHHLGT